MLPRTRPLPWQLSWRACWLNSFRPVELHWWWSLGVRQWHELASHHSDSLAWALHAQRRDTWPDQCRPALRLLANKADLLSACPESWRAPFLVIEATSSPPLHPPTWWAEALKGPGLVIKPLGGHGGRGVVRFLAAPSGVEQQALFWRLAGNAPRPSLATALDPHALLHHWQQLCHTQEAALATPFLAHSSVLPPSDPSVVVRVITARDAPEGPIAILLAWLEVPLGQAAVAFVNLHGRALPQPRTTLSPPQQEALGRWQELLKEEVPACIRGCLKGAVALHALLPPIDQVAWDWIPAEPQPLLLEGNGSFSLLVPQLFARMNLDPSRLP